MAANCLALLTLIIVLMCSTSTYFTLDKKNGVIKKFKLVSYTLKAVFSLLQACLFIYFSKMAFRFHKMLYIGNKERFTPFKIYVYLLTTFTVLNMLYDTFSNMYIVLSIYFHKDWYAAAF